MSASQISPTYILARSLPILFSYTAFLCLAYFLLAALFGGIRFITHPLSLIIEILGLVEVLWYILWFLPYRKYLQRKHNVGMRADGRGGGNENELRRRETFRWALDHTPDVEDFVRGWMNHARVEDIRRDNIKEWLLWWLFGRDNDGCGSKPDDNTDIELDDYIYELETRLGFGFKPGRSDAAKPLRLGVDSVEMSHRSLVYYGLIAVVDVITTMYLLLKGFSFYRQPSLAGFFATYPFRPFLLLFTPNVSAATSLSYFYRRHTSPVHRPVVFLHGAGIGLATYLPFLNKIPKEVGVIAIEILPLSNRITIPNFSSTSLLLSSRPPTVSTLDVDVEHEQVAMVAEELQRILNQHGNDFDDFVLVAHSFGSLFLAPILACQSTTQRIDSVVLIDPVAFLCHLPDVAYNFLRRPPTTASEWGTWWLASRDPMIAHTLARQWWSGPGDWRATALWRAQLRGKRTTVILGSEDVVIPSKAIASYIFYGDVNFHDQTAQRVEEWRTFVKRWTGARELELLYMEGSNHGQILLPGPLSTMQHVVEMYCHRDKVVSATLQKLGEMV